MTVTQSDLAERLGVTWDSNGQKEPAQATVTGWIDNTVPRTIAEYDATSTDELILDLAEDRYLLWHWMKRHKASSSVTTPSGSVSGPRPKYPSDHTKEKHGLVKTKERLYIIRSTEWE